MTSQKYITARTKELMALGYDAETATTMAVIDRVQALKVEAQSVNQSGG